MSLQLIPPDLVGSGVRNKKPAFGDQWPHLGGQESLPELIYFTETVLELPNFFPDTT